MIEKVVRRGHLLGLIAAFIIFNAAATFCVPAEYWVGRSEGKIDLLLGKRMLRVQAETADAGCEFSEILDKEFGIKVNAEFNYAPKALYARISGYNEVQINALEKIYGKGFLDIARKTAYYRMMHSPCAERGVQRIY
ncbi:MAG TPA: hypothetical protein VFC63_21705 [Blastocatellia bacterium]|nr:hypothetical protein [Blastocatellia bacterium]